MPKSSTPSFVVTLPLRLSTADKKFLDRSFDLAVWVRNATLNTALGRVVQMKQSKEWRDTCTMPKGEERSRRFPELRGQFGFREYDLHAVAAKHWNASGRKPQLGCNEVQKLATAVFRSVDRWLLHQGGRPRFKNNRRGLHSIEGKTNKSGIIWKPAQFRRARLRA